MVQWHTHSTNLKHFKTKCQKLKDPFAIPLHIRVLTIPMELGVVLDAEWQSVEDGLHCIQLVRELKASVRGLIQICVWSS